MKFNLELPEDVLLMNRAELKAVLQEILSEMNVTNATEEVMTIQQTAKFLKVSVPTVRTMITKRDIPFFQRGQIIRLNRWDVLKWLKENTRQH